MKKIYLLLMLFLGCVGSASAFSVNYNFSSSWMNNITLGESFTINMPARDYDGWYGGGYSQGWGAEALTTQVATLNHNNGTVSILAFNPIQYNGQTAWRYGWGNNRNGIKNNSDQNNVFSVLNLRAGEIVKVKMWDGSTGNNINTRFVVNHSPNAADNLPWTKVNGIPGAEKISITEWEQQFLMLEDGNLDLKVAAWSMIEEITIESNYTTFRQERAQVGTPINLQLQCRKFQTGNGTYRFNMIEPVVLYRGDLTPGTVTVSKTNDSEQTGNTGTFSITISGFSGKQYENGYWEGGSIIVMLDNTMVTYTVPYEVAKQAGNAQPNSASWNFWQRELQVGRSTDPAYKSLLAHDIAEGAFQHGATVHAGLSDASQPLSLYKGTMNGQNAYYNAETAGLIFEGNANIYGLLNETTDPVSNGDRWIALRKGGKMIIPGLKKGDQVWMFVDHYGSATTPQGNYKATTLSWYVTNATDALGKTIDSSKPLVTGGATWGPAVNGKWAKQYYSAMHFFAASNGDMTFTVDGTDNTNYAKICYIKILKADAASGAGQNGSYGNIEPTNQILGHNADDHGYEFLTIEAPDGTRTASSGSLTLHESGRGSLIQKWKVLEASGTINANVYNGAINNDTPPVGNPADFHYGPYFHTGWTTNPIKFKYTSHVDVPAFGSFLLRGMDYDHDGEYCVDYADRVIAVFIYQELGYALAWGNEWMAMLTEAGVPAQDVATRIKFNMGISTVYFMEIAKFRAARMLWAQIVKQYNPECDCACKMVVNAATTEFTQTVFDSYVNLLRSQTQAMSAALAGVDSIVVAPFDKAYQTPDDFSERIARNQQILLKEESHLDKVVDPAGGSYYIETLTMSIAQEAWKLFIEVEDKGGFKAVQEAGEITAAVNASAQSRFDKVAKRREQLLGTNHFRNFPEKSEGKAAGINYEAQPEGVLNRQRLASHFEQLRLATENAAHTPKVFMLTIGNLTMRLARAQFSSNFFACAGYEIIDNNGFNTVEEGIDAALEKKADVIVLCSSDPEYDEYAPAAFKYLNGRTEFVIAGPENDAFKELGIKYFINVKSNVQATLTEFNAKLLK